jgi:ferredoxin
LGLVGLILLTLLAGRVYCSAICPLGVLQDIASRLADFAQRQPKFLRYAPPLTVVRQVFLWGSVAAILVGWGSFALALFDPYSNFGRLVTEFVRPVARLAGQAVSGWAGWKYQGIRRGEPVWASTTILVVASVIPVLVILFSAWRGRLYCNTICPVGTLLGAISRRAYFKLEIDESACGRCADCLRSCKAQCIDLRARRIDHSRCVGCFNCLSVCERNAVALRSSRFKKASPGPKIAEPAKVPEPVGTDRRDFLRQTGAVLVLIAGATAAFGGKVLAAGNPENANNGTARTNRGLRVIAPPGSGGVERLLDRCTGCHLCIGACPTRVLKPAFLEYGLEGLLKPQLDFSRSYCSYDCTTCGEVCPENAISRLTLADKRVTRIGVAQVIPAKCKICMICVRQCPTQAIIAEPKDGYFSIPEVNVERCIGCGLCEAVCPVLPKAVKVTGCAVHEREPKLLP